MKVNEFRIGNLVNSVLSGNPYTVDIWALRTIEDGNFQNLYTTDIKVFEPIPLTEEWLCRLGFDKICIPTSINGINTKFFKKGDFVVYLLSDSFEVELITKSGNQFNLFKNFKEEIHILQNLYFALTGEELNIEL